MTTIFGVEIALLREIAGTWKFPDDKEAAAEIEDFYAFIDRARELTEGL